MTVTASKIAKKQILAAKTSTIRSLNNEKALKYELSAFFQRLKEKVLQELEVYYNPDFMFQAQADLILACIHEAHREYYSILEKYNKKEYRFGEREAKRLTRLAMQRHRKQRKRYADKSETTHIKPEDLIHTKINKDELFATNPWSEQRLLNKSFIASENTMQRIDGSINKILTEGYQGGKGIKEVRNDLVKRFDQLKDWEANRIARTEIHNAHQMGIMNTYEDMGVEYTQWSAAQDDRTRDTHMDIDGEIIALGDTFSNGLGYPGDTTGPIEEWINCRCSNVPFIMPYGYTAPTFTPFRESDIIPTLDLYDQNDILNQLAEEATQEANQQIPNSPQIEGLNKYALDAEQLQLYNELKSEDALLFLDKMKLKDLEEQIRFNELHNKFLKEGKLEGSDDFYTNSLHKEYLKLQSHLKDDLGITEPVEMSDLEGKPKPEPTEVTIEPEYIDPHDLFISTSELVESNGKWYYKGMETNYSGENVMMTYLDADAVKEHNKLFESTPEIINTSDLIMTGGDDNPAYVIDGNTEGFKIVNGKPYYKGLELKDFDLGKGYGKIYEYEIDKHNKDLIFGDMELPALSKVEEIMSPEFYEKYEHLKEQIEWGLGTQTSSYVSALGKKMALEVVENELPNFKQLNDEALEKIKESEQPQTMELFSHEDMFELPDDGGYLVIEDISTLTYNENLETWEYKGVEVDYMEGDTEAYIDIDVADDFLQDLEKGIHPYELTMDEIELLEVDTDGDYIIDETYKDKVYINSSTGEYEYKGVELAYYDPSSDGGYIESGVMEKYIEDHNLQSSGKSKVIHDILTEGETANGEKCVIDETGREWVIDNTGKYEHEQDIAQHEVRFTSDERNSGEFWGHYGHHNVSNLIYGDEAYSDWAKYSDLMNEITPILDEMKAQSEIIENGTFDDSISPEEYRSATHRYMELYREFEEIANSVDDFEVTKTLYNIMDIDKIIVKSPGLLQDTCLIRYGHFDESMCVKGKRFSFEGFLSFSYADATDVRPDATKHFADKPQRWKIVILAPAETPGTRLNTQFHALTSEREFLSQRGQDFEVLDYGKIPDPNHPDGERNSVTIRLIND